MYEELPSTIVAYQATANHFKGHTLKPGGSLSLSGQNGPFTCQLSGSADYRYNHSVTEEESILGNLLPNDLVREERIADFFSQEVSANLAVARYD